MSPGGCSVADGTSTEDLFPYIACGVHHRTPNVFAEAVPTPRINTDPMVQAMTTRRIPDLGTRPTALGQASLSVTPRPEDVNHTKHCAPTAIHHFGRRRHDCNEVVIGSIRVASLLTVGVAVRSATSAGSPDSLDLSLNGSVRSV